MAEEGNRVRSDGVVSSSRDFFSIEDMLAVTGAVERYAASSKSTLAADKLATEQGKPMQVFWGILKTDIMYKYICTALSSSVLCSIRPPGPSLTA